ISALNEREAKLELGMSLSAHDPVEHCDVVQANERSDYRLRNMKLPAEFNDRACIHRVGADIAITHDRSGNPERQRHAAAINHPIKDACRHVSDGEHLLSRKESGQNHTPRYATSYICEVSWQRLKFLGFINSLGEHRGGGGPDIPQQFHADGAIL